MVRSTVAEGSSIGEGAELDGSLVGRSCRVGPGSRLLEGSALGDEVNVGEDATIEPGVSVYPGKHIEDEADVAEELTDESGA